MDTFFDSLMSSAGRSIDRLMARKDLKYHLPDGSWIGQLSAVVGEIQKVRIEGDQGARHVRTRMLTVLTDQCSQEFRGVESLHAKGQWEIDGEMWSIEEIDAQTPYEIHCRLIETKQSDFVPRGYRRDRFR